MAFSKTQMKNGATNSNLKTNSNILSSIFEKYKKNQRPTTFSIYNNHFY